MSSHGEPPLGERLTWSEPRGFRRSSLTASRNSVLRIVVVTACATLIFIGIANWIDPWTELTWKLLIVGGGIVIICLLMWVGACLVPFTVRITDKAIVVEDVSDTATVYRFATIDRCEIGSMHVGSETYSVLVIEGTKGDREIIALAPTVSEEVLRMTLEHRGVSVVTRSASLSEQLAEDEVNGPD